ncbi:hypothetical protein [Mycobacterium antarcticum]|uniref:hypothetical protein n=1 Tax=Mycolicibacterium sp. TUM20984 TaxID=3023368 RepID=UPI0023A46A55|nr:hypothetical protein [Mycolicibacterium sp. TUM20984]GLP81026.1 hypothetical protein TUM20984_24460 [Mycolicibacterium sp. TUM20984]
MTMTATNRPYTFELAALALPNGDLDDVRKTATVNGVTAAELERAIGILRILQEGGEDVEPLCCASTSTAGSRATCR